MNDNNGLESLFLPRIKLFDIYFKQKDDTFIDVDSYGLDEIMEGIGIVLDAFIISLEMKGDENPDKIFEGIISSYSPELGNIQIHQDSWNEGINGSAYKKKRDKYLENLFILFKLKYLFVYGINSIINSPEEKLSFVDTNSLEFNDFADLDRNEEIHIGTSLIKKYALFEWINPFIDLFESHKKTTIAYSYLYRYCYQGRTLSEFVNTSYTLVNQKIDTKIEEYKKYVGFSYFAIDKTTRENLNRKLQPVIESIELVSPVFPEIKSKFLEKKRGCLAGMKFLKKHYASISGITMKGEDKLGKVLWERYGITLIKLSPDVRYYFTNNKYITYKDFEDWRDIFLCEDRYLRMFSCCERKLLTVIYDTEFRYNQHCLMYVTLPPCQMCVRSINAMEKELYIHVKIRCTSSISKSDNMNEDNYIELAETIYNNNNIF